MHNQFLRSEQRNAHSPVSAPIFGSIVGNRVNGQYSPVHTSYDKEQSERWMIFKSYMSEAHVCYAHSKLKRNIKKNCVAVLNKLLISSVQCFVIRIWCLAKQSIDSNTKI